MSEDQNSQAGWQPNWGSGTPPWGTGTPPWGTGPPPWISGQPTVTQVVTQTTNLAVDGSATTISGNSGTQTTTSPSSSSDSTGQVTVTVGSVESGSSDKSNRVPIIVGSVISAIGLLSLLFAAAFLYLRHRRKQARRITDPLSADENQTNAATTATPRPPRNINGITPFDISQPASVHIQKLPLPITAEKGGAEPDSKPTSSPVTESSGERSNRHSGLANRTGPDESFFADGPPPYSPN
ncbi:hypothetical protein VNI00_006809 [Paramarasmius palmivorus]|uniref:Transmembrane protein n=1 Tax=Paramarasmius palmivorus TaxID=297713 RepID=A0AAW0D928_9AGAR